MLAALACRQRGEPVNRKRVQRVMRTHRLLQRSWNGDRRRPGFLPATRPDELRHIDMTVRTVQYGWIYLHAVIDCCTGELVSWRVDLRCRDDEAIAAVDAAVRARRVAPGRAAPRQWQRLQLTSRDFRTRLSTRGPTRRRAGYHDPNRRHS